MYGEVVVPRRARILWLMIFYIHALFLSSSFNFLIKEVVLPPPVCFCMCIILELFSTGICLIVLLVLWVGRVCCSLCTTSDCLSIDRNIPSIVDVFSKRAFVHARL